MSNTPGARRFIAATASAIRTQGRAMLAAAPWSLAVFTLSLPFALLTPKPYQFRDWLFVALALVNLIAFARMSYAWHRVVNHAADDGAARGSAGEARHLVLLAALAIGVTYLARVCGDLPFVLYALLDGKTDTVFFACLTALMALIWLPVLYALAVAGLSLPRVAVTGEYGFRDARAAMRYPRWPLMLALLLLLAIGSFVAMDLQPLLYYPTGARIAYGVVGTLLCVLITFLLMTMVAVAYRDRAGQP